MDTNRNTLLAIALSLLVLLGWQFLYVSPKIEAERNTGADHERREDEGRRQRLAEHEVPERDPEQRSSERKGREAAREVAREEPEPDEVARECDDRRFQRPGNHSRR